MPKPLCLTVLCALPLALSAPCFVRAADDADGPAKEVAVKFVKALQAKDVKGAIKLAAVPWFDVADEKLIKTEKELEKTWEAKLEHLDPAEIVTESVEVAPFAKLNIKDESVRKLLEEVVGKNGRIVVVAREDGFGGRFFLVQVRDGKAAVVGGPAGMAYLRSNNKIPADARAILDKAESVQLLSLDPTREEKPPPDAFHGWKVLGSTFVKGAAKQRLAGAFKQGVVDNEGAAAGCFHPRHGIRVTEKDRVVDFVICFQCYNVLLYDGAKREKGFVTTSTPQPIFDEILKDAKVPLAKKADD